VQPTFLFGHRSEGPLPLTPVLVVLCGACAAALAMCAIRKVGANEVFFIFYFYK
jgi:hypothetical protein